MTTATPQMSSGSRASSPHDLGFCTANAYAGWVNLGRLGQQSSRAWRKADSRSTRNPAVITHVADVNFSQLCGDRWCLLSPMAERLALSMASLPRLCPSDQSKSGISPCCSLAWPRLQLVQAKDPQMLWVLFRDSGQRRERSSRIYILEFNHHVRPTDERVGHLN